jgi:protein-S-isoprenylcysteine O-methyltransferase Ste14
VTAILWTILYWAWIASEVLLVVVTRTRGGSGDVRDRGSIFVLWAVIFSSIFVGSWYGATHAHTIFGGALWVRAASVALLAAGLALRWAAVLSLGRAFSVNVAIRTDQRLYRSGMYAVVRHPSYTGMMVIFAAVGMHTRNWLAVAIVLVPAFAALLYRIRVEEEALAGAFGEEYLQYSRSTKRLLPGIY